jgi:hypothetical protein
MTLDVMAHSLVYWAQDLAQRFWRRLQGLRHDQRGLDARDRQPRRSQRGESPQPIAASWPEFAKHHTA